MIQANELRIGNWVNLGEHSHVEVCKLEEGKTSFEPIEITQEILLCCGFKQSKKHQNIYHKGKWRIWLRQKWNYFFKSGDLLHTNMAHLHQLQNLYYALTGTELEINL